MWINYYVCWAAHESLLGFMWPMGHWLSKADLPAQKEKGVQNLQRFYHWS